MRLYRKRVPRCCRLKKLQRSRKRTCVDVAKGRQQAKLYADLLEKKYHRRPVIFLTNGFETRMDVTITEVSLTLMRIRDKGSSQGTIVPVWDFWGSWSWYAPGTDTSEVMQNGVSCRQPMLTLNAVDGTVVSRLFGY